MEMKKLFILPVALFCAGLNATTLEFTVVKNGEKISAPVVKLEDGQASLNIDGTSIKVVQNEDSFTCTCGDKEVVFVILPGQSDTHTCVKDDKEVVVTVTRSEA